MKYFLEEYRKVNSIIKQRNRFSGRNKALVCYRTTEKVKTGLADIIMYQGWTVEMYRSTNKDKQK